MSSLVPQRFIGGIDTCQQPYLAELCELQNNSVPGRYVDWPGWTLGCPVPW